MKSFLIALAVCLLPSLASAQTQVPAGVPLTATFTHTGTNVAGYRLKLDGKPLPDIPTSALQNGTVASGVPAVSAGSHNLVACAFNVAGEACGPTLAFSGVALPAAPGNLTITVQVAIAQDGAVSVLGVQAQRR